MELHDELNTAFGFSVPKPYVTLHQLARSLQPNDYRSAFEALLLWYLDDHGRPAVTYTAPPEFMVLGWTGTDSAQYGFIVDDPQQPREEYPIGVHYPSGTETQILALSIADFLGYLICIGHEFDRRFGNRPDPKRTELEQHLRAKFLITVPNSSQALQQAAHKVRHQGDVVETADGQGVAVPLSTFDRKYVKSLAWRKPGLRSEKLPADPRRLDEAEKRLRRGEIGTALVVARNYQFHHWYDDWQTGKQTIHRTSDIMERAYRQLGREFIANQLRARTNDAIANVG